MESATSRGWCVDFFSLKKINVWHAKVCRELIPNGAKSGTREELHAGKQIARSTKDLRQSTCHSTRFMRHNRGPPKNTSIRGFIHCSPWAKSGPKTGFHKQIAKSSALSRLMARSNFKIICSDPQIGQRQLGWWVSTVVEAGGNRISGQRCAG